MRCLAFTELADDPAVVRRLKELYDTLDTATTPATVLLPWLPGPSAIRKLVATKRIYDIVSRTLDERVEKGIVRDDTPQMLIDAGDERLVIIGVSSESSISRAASLPASCVFAPAVCRSVLRYGSLVCDLQSIRTDRRSLRDSLSWACLSLAHAPRARQVRVAWNVLRS